MRETTAQRADRLIAEWKQNLAAKFDPPGDPKEIDTPRSIIFLIGRGVRDSAFELGMSISTNVTVGERRDEPEFQTINIISPDGVVRYRAYLDLALADDEMRLCFPYAPNGHFEDKEVTFAYA